jgi:phage/plasmid-associated DNA primase
MQYNFKTQELTSKGVDFNAIYPDKQDTVKQMTGFDFNLSNIVSFLKKETNDYEKQTPLALDIDKHIYSVYLKWQQAEGKSTEDKKTEEQKASAPVESTEDKPVDQPSKKTLETRLKIVKAMIKKDPSNTVLKTRIKIIEKKLKEA